MVIVDFFYRFSNRSILSCYHRKLNMAIEWRSFYLKFFFKLKLNFVTIIVPDAISENKPTYSVTLKRTAYYLLLLDINSLIINQSSVIWQFGIYLPWTTYYFHSQFNIFFISFTEFLFRKFKAAFIKMENSFINTNCTIRC